MDSQQFLNLNATISLTDGALERSLPDWSAAFIWIGAWCRQHQLPGKRLITLALLPNRTLASAFVGIGSLIEGARAFRKTISWPRFRNLPAGTTVHWKQNDNNFSGRITGLVEIDGAEYIQIELTKPISHAKKGITQLISMSSFESYRFSEDKPPSAIKSASYEGAARLFGHLLGSVDPEWIWADGAEAILVTGLSAFDRSMSGLSIMANGENSLLVQDLLCTGKSNDQTHAKLRVTHPRGRLTGDYPLAILDGAEAFHSHLHLSHVPNLIIILDRSEYQEEIYNNILLLKGASDSHIPEKLRKMPDSFPCGIELASFIIDRS